MTLDKYKKGTISLRDRYKSLDDSAFTKLAAENMAKLFLKIYKDKTSFLPNSKLIKHRIINNENAYTKWAEEVNKIEFKKRVKAKLKEVNDKPYINETLTTKGKIINIRGGFMNKPNEDGLYEYNVCLYKNEQDFENHEHDEHMELLIPGNINSEEIEKKSNLVYNFVK